MLSKKDKEFLKEIVKEAVTEALTMDMTWEEKRDPETGMPRPHPKVITESVFLPSYLCQILPYHEGALRGVQETSDKQRATLNKTSRSVEALASIMIQAESAFKMLAAYKEKIELENPELNLIEDKLESNNPE